MSMSVDEMAGFYAPDRVLRRAAKNRRAALDNLHDCARIEHEAVWRAIDEGWSWPQVADLLGLSLTVTLHRHRDRGESS